MSKNLETVPEVQQLSLQIEDQEEQVRQQENEGHVPPVTLTNQIAELTAERASVEAKVVLKSFEDFAKERQETLAQQRKKQQEKL